MIRVNLAGLEPIAFLQSEDGTVKTVGDKFVIQGQFSLVIGETASDPLTFSGNAVVVKLNEQWELSSVAQVYFFFSKPLTFHDARLGPSLQAQNISLFQRATSNSIVLVGLTDVKVSLVGHLSPSSSGKLLYPSASGAQEVTLIPAPHPQDTSRVGYFLVSSGQGFSVQLGFVSARTNIDHAKLTQLVIHTDCSLSFMLTDTGHTFVVDASTAEKGAPVLAKPDSGMLMAANPGAEKWSRVQLAAHTVEVSGGWIRVPKFAPHTVWLGRVMDVANSVGDATGIFTPTERLTYELSTPRPDDADDQIPKARLHYRDEGTKQFAAGAPGAPGDRHFGVRVQGLGSKYGVPATLDASVAVFNLSNADASPKLHLLAGGGDDAIPSGDGTEDSLLLAKFDPRAGFRQLNVPVGDLSLEIGQTANMTLDTAADKGFTVSFPELSSRPAGITAGAANDGGEGFDRWVLALPGDSNSLSFGLGDSALRPKDGAGWLGKFQTKNPAKQYSLIEHPGAGIAIDLAQDARGFSSEAGIAADDQVERTGFTTKHAGGKEWVAYSAFFGVLSFVGYRLNQDGAEKFLDPSRFKVKLTALNDAAAEKYVKKNALGDLCVVYSAAADDNGSAARGIRAFIDDNMREPGKPDPTLFAWPFAMGLHILLHGPSSSTEGAPQAYCDEIAQIRRGAKAQPTVAFDLSGESRLDPDWFGWDASDWEKFAEESPALWPRAKGRTGGRSDPTDTKWRGVFFRDLPLIFPLPKVSEELPFLKELLDKINDNLMLDYGWHDESGATWSGSIVSGNKDSGDPGLEFTPGGWASTLQMFLTRVGVKGAASKIVSAEAECVIRLNRIKDKQGKPLEIEGAFILNLEGGHPVPRIELSTKGDRFETDSIPGFSAVILNRIVISNLKTAQFDLDLIATPELAHALPAFSDAKPQKATLVFNLDGTPSATLSLTLPSEVDTNLFGRWPITLEGISIKFAASVELRIRGRLHLGLPAFSAIGGWIVVTAGTGGVKFNVELEEVSGEISLGSSKVSMNLKWADKDHLEEPVPIDKVSVAGADRDFYGSLIMEDSGVLGRNSLAVRVGNRGELSFWIAAIESTAEIPLGVGKLQNPALLLAHHAEFDGNMAKALTDPTGSILSLLRPKEGDLRAWLAEWEPSKEVGTLVAASGYLHLHDQIAASPADPKAPVNPDLLSSLIFTDSGLVRIDGVAMLLSVATIRFGIAVDFKAKRLLAGLQAPTISVPDPQNPQYQIQSGYIALGIGFGDDPYLSLRIGWPERIGNTEFDRDWSKSVKIYVQNMFPINTFWGGMRSDFDPGKGQIIMGWAIRAGWTWAIDKGFVGVRGRADLGIALGGVFQFAFLWKERSENQPMLLSPRHSSEAVKISHSPLQRLVANQLHPNASDERLIVLAAIDLVEQTIRASSVDVAMSAELFGDIWGDASVEFLGVTLAAIHLKVFARFVVCGSFRSGITKAKGTLGFEVSVTILCVTYSAHASLDITLIDGSCPLMLEDHTIISQQDLTSLFPVS